ncbi:carbohydrate-binding protein [Catellatospora sp. KI3]|uniref:fascin domain-containing protein n=1 Tax=Catellatospora sp. KI3 TaxID=3041620 RepID=UPI0024823C7F|nr:carbohydrate-binding protein [Catellatospora sp. KI3]MDI1465036.1 carbohydrate-binding protein [Catellatospora sp. KI3]
MRQRTVPRLLAAAVLAAGLLTAAPAGPAAASPTDAAFNSGTGALNVDYAGYLSKHDLVYNKPNTNPLHGLTVGNGRTGAMAWSANGLTMQVSGVDLSQQSAFAAGNLNFNTSPSLDSGYTTYQQRLSLYDGTLTTKYDGNRTVTVMGSPNSEVMGVHVDDSRGGVAGATLELSLWDPNGVSNSADVPNLTTWRTVQTGSDASAAWFSRGQADPNNFGYTFAATVEGAAYSASVVNGTRVRLSITPTSSYTIWFTAASRLNSPNLDSVAQAKNQLASVKSTGYATTLNNYRNWWHSFWQKSFVQYSNSAGDADYLENVYYLATYMIAAGGHGNYPYHFINGVFRATGDQTKWSNGYWYWNQRDVYNSFFASNHADLMAGFNKLYSRNFNALKAYTQTRYGTDSLWVPETMGWDGNARGTIGSDFVNDIYSTGTEAAYNMYLQYKYTNDTTYLRDVAYPYMREALRFYQNRFQLINGRYQMPTSNAHETYWDVRNAITDLAAVRLLAPLTIQVSTQLGLDSGLRAGWQNLVDNLWPYQVSNNAWLPHDPPTAQTRNGENVSAELIWPYDRTGIGAADYGTAVNTWNVRPNPYSNVWANDHAQAARLGLGDQAFSGMRLMLQRYQNYPNGMTNNTNGVFEYLGIHLVAMNESLLQSYNGRIRVFPAVPTDSSMVTRFTLLAQDGFLVSSEREAGEIKYVGLKSQFGKDARVVNPWGTQQVRVRRTSDNAIITTSTAAEVTFSTAANTVYVLERTAKPLTNYSAATLTGTANNDVKSLRNTASTLGLPGGAVGGLVNDTELSYDANWFQTTNRGYGDYNDDTHHTTTVNAAASYTFTGTGVEYLSERFSDMGNVDVYLDNVLQANVNLNVGGARQAQQVVWSKTGLASGQHTIRIVNKTTSVAIVDALRITTGGTPPGTTYVGLKAQANAQWVSAPNATTALIANKTAVGTTEQFEVVDRGGGSVWLRSRANGQYVCAENAGANPLVANRASAGAWETFTLVRNSDGTVSFLAQVNNRYVVAENGGAAALIANRTAIGPWEKFDMITQ